MKIYSLCYQEILSADGPIGISSTDAIASTSSPPLSPRKGKGGGNTNKGDVTVNDQEIRRVINEHLEGFHLLNCVASHYADPDKKVVEQPGPERRRRGSEVNKFEREILALNCNIQMVLSEAEELNNEIEALKKQRNVILSSHADAEDQNNEPATRRGLFREDPPEDIG